MAISVGIDLGTTNSALAVHRLTPTVLPNREGEYLTPSCVTAIPTAAGVEFVVGRAARDLRKQYPQTTVTSVKRLMGREFDEPEVQKLIAEGRHGYPIETDRAEPGSLRVRLDDAMYTPEALSAMILRKIVGDAAAELGESRPNAVVTVPAYFSDRQKFATRAACEQAGLRLLRLLPEPTAAAIAFGLAELPEDATRTVMVFDLGGGTFDVSILSVAGRQFMEVTKGGDMWLGGDDIDKVVADLVFAAAAEQNGCAPIATLAERLPPAERARFNAEVRESCERAKIELSTSQATTVEVFGLLRDEHGKLVDIDVSVTRSGLEAALAPMIARLVAITDDILRDIAFEPELIDTVLMVGGSSLIPAVQAALVAKFGADKVKVHPRPMYAVVEGAAIMAHRLAARVDETASDTMRLMHSAAHDYYLQLAGGQKHLLVARNTPLPCRVEQRLSFAQLNQRLARLRIFNDVDGVLETVGEHWFFRDQGDPLSPVWRDKRGERPELVLGFAIDEDNIIRIETWTDAAPERKTDSIIARGGLAMRLYADLESTLSWILLHQGSADGESAIALSRLIDATILQVSDPVSGAVRHDVKSKAFRQIEALRALALADLDPLNGYLRARVLADEAMAAMPTPLQPRLAEVVRTLDVALRELTDVEALKAADDEWGNIWEADDDVAELAEAADIASQGEGKWPGDSRRLRGYFAAIGTARQTGDAAALATAFDALRGVASRFTDKATRSERRFDRDVVLTSSP